MKDAPALFAVTESGDTVYYGVNSDKAAVTLGSVKKDGTGQTKILSATDTGGSGITVLKNDGSHLYWLANAPGSIETYPFRRPLAGGAVEKLSDAFVHGSTAMALTSQTVFWTGGPDAFAVPKPGGTTKTTYGMTAGREGGVHAASNGTDVVWIEWFDPNNTLATTNVIRSGDESGGPAQTLVTATSFPWGLGVDATDVYYSLAGKEIARVPLAGGAATTLYKGQINSDLATDATRVYFLENDGVCRTLKSVPKQGGAAATLATGLPGGKTAVEQGNHITVDATDVFVGTFSGSVFKITK